MEENSQGVIVGCDAAQEWLLPWWWSHFHAHNPTTAVAFADFGMSSKAQSWCQEKGTVFSIEPSPLHTNPDPNAMAEWDHRWQNDGEIRDYHEVRKTWFKKPMAMISSPFFTSIWIDLDCEIRGSLAPLFSLSLSPAKIAATTVEFTHFIRAQGSDIKIPHYNTGVVLFEKDSPLLHLWVQSIHEGSKWAFTEEDLLAILIDYFRIPITPLSPLYNWHILRFGFRSDATIYHWMGDEGKKAIHKKQSLSFFLSD